FGLSRGITDTILDVIGENALHRVSVLANGYATDYALNEWKKCSNNLLLSVHLNLTEGKALSDPKHITHLVDSRGIFKNSPFLLLVKTFFALPHTRAVIKEEIVREFEAQIKYVHARVGDNVFGVDGHQHVHMVPLAFSALLALNAKYKFSNVRFPREPFFLNTSALGTYLGAGMLRHLALNILSHINHKKAAGTDLPSTDFFIGTLMSGNLTLQNVTLALQEAAARGARSV